MSLFGVKKQHNVRGNKSNKKLMKIINADAKRKPEKMVLSDDSCQNITNLSLEKNLELKEIDEQESPEMLFPVEVNKYLREKVEALTEENGRLQRSLEETEAQLKVLESKCPPALHGRASDLAASKIVELSKKIRELTAELEVTKLRARNAENQQIQKKTKEVIAVEKEVIKKPESELLNEVKDLTEKLNAANLKLCESRNQIQQLKHELKMTQKALTNEVGQNVSVQSILSGKGWRGRAQQICGLQQRLSQLSEKLASHEQGTSVNSNESIATIRQVEKDIRAELTQELKESRKDLDQMKNKWAAVKARCRVLENDLTASKDKITTLLEKTSHDNQLISTLTSQINNMTEKHKEELQGAVKRLEQNCITLENQLDIEKTRNNQLQTVLENREEQISELQEKIKSLLKTLEGEGTEKMQINDNTVISNLNNISCTPDGNNINGSQDLLGQVAEAECVRLTELIQVLNKRLDAQRLSSMQTEEELRIERQKSAKLETKVARLELERVGADKSPATYSQNLNRGSANENAISEKAKEKIELLEERCAALKTRLQCVCQEKEDDLHRMTCLLGEAKKSYMEALKRNKTSSSVISFKD